MARGEGEERVPASRPSPSLRERYHLRSGDIGSPVLGAPIPTEGRAPDEIQNEVALPGYDKQ